MRIQFLFVVFLFSSYHGLAKCSTVSVLKSITDVMSLGLSLIDFIDSPDKKDDTKIAEFKTLMGNYNVNILKGYLLISRYEDIDEAFRIIKSSSEDLINFIEAISQSDKESRKGLFIKRFDFHRVIMHLRFLPDLLEYHIPGTEGRFVDLFAKSCRCSMKNIYEFRLFYDKLLSEGIALHLVYIKLATNITVNKTLEDWESKIAKTKEVFKRQELECMNKFPVYAQEDVQNAGDAVTLWNDLGERYPSKVSSVFFLSEYESDGNQFLYYKAKENTIFRTIIDDKNKIAVITDRNGTSLNISHLESNLAKVKVPDEGNAAEIVANDVEHIVNISGNGIKVLLVYFEGGKFPSRKVIVDNSSFDLQFSIQHVRQKYKYFCRKKSVEGQMKIFIQAIPLDLSLQLDYTTGQGCACEATLSFVSLLVIGFLSYCCLL